MIKKVKAGVVNGSEISLYTLDNGRGFTAEIYNYGGIIRNLAINGRDIVLGREAFEDYLNNDGYLGAAIGRHANRIKNSRFVLNGKEYTVGANENDNSLHGGVVGFDKYVWNAEEIDGAEPALMLSIESPDGDEGFPGNLSLKMTYTLTAENSFKIHYEAVCDKDTVLNLTNHSYFNLDGHNSGTVYNQTLWLNSEFYTPNNDECMPYGEILSVKGTPFDFTTAKKIGQDISSDYEQTKMFGGYDHNFALCGRGFRKVAALTSSDGTIEMDTYTDLPGIQVYSANCLEAGCYKGGASYGKHNAVCLETQFFPNSMDNSHFIAPVLKAGDKFDSVTEYKFIIK